MFRRFSKRASVLRWIVKTLVETSIFMGSRILRCGQSELVDFEGVLPFDE